MTEPLIEEQFTIDQIKSVRFTAQVWVRDYAQEIDPKGDVVWEPSDLKALLSGYRDIDDAFCYEAWFADDPNCPAWIKQHDGPFFIRVEEATSDV